MDAQISHHSLSGLSFSFTQDSEGNPNLIVTINNSGESFVFAENETQELLSFFAHINEIVSAPGRSTKQAGVTRISYNQETIRAITKRLLQRVSNESKQRAELVIYLPQDDVPIALQEKIMNACGDFMEAMGFEVEMKEEPILGSWFQRMWWRLTSKKTEKEIQEIYSKSKKALEVRYLNLPTAEATEKLSNAASNVLNSLKDTDEACVRLGAVMIVKANIDGKTKVMIESISPQLSTTLENYPTLQQSPAAMFQLLQAEKEQNKMIEGAGSDVVASE